MINETTKTLKQLFTELLENINDIKSEQDKNVIDLKAKLAETRKALEEARNQGDLSENQSYKDSLENIGLYTDQLERQLIAQEELNKLAEGLVSRKDLEVPYIIPLAYCRLEVQTNRSSEIVNVLVSNSKYSNLKFGIIAPDSIMAQNLIGYKPGNWTVYRTSDKVRVRVLEVY